MSQRPDDELDPRVERTQQRVFEATLAILASDGLPAVTHTRVAEDSGVGRATLYRHWPDVSALLVDALASRHPALAAEVQDDLDLRSAATALVAGAVATLRDDPIAPALLALLARADHDPLLAEVREAMAQRMGGVIDAVLLAAQGRGEVPGDLDLDRATAMLAGPVFFARLVLARPFDEQDVAPHVDAWLRAIDHRPAGRSRPA